MIKMACNKCGLALDVTSVTAINGDAIMYLNECASCASTREKKAKQLAVETKKLMRNNTIMFIVTLVALFVMILVAAPVAVQIALNCLGTGVM